MYAAGWVAKGPVGVLTSTLNIAHNAADLLLADHFSSEPIQTSADSPLQTFPEKGLPQEVEKGLKEKQVVSMESWNMIDQAEIRRARDSGSRKPREKFTRVEEMLQVIQ
jgi:adrenodoxin-NADP+ reductase